MNKTIKNKSKVCKARQNVSSVNIGGNTALGGGLMLAVLLAFSAHVHADSIRLYDQMGVAGPQVTLGEIAELEGEYAESLSDLVIAKLGPQQPSLRLQIATVRRIMTEAQVNWSDLSLKGKAECVVSRIDGKASTPVKVDNDRAVTSNNEITIDHTLAGQTVSDLILVELVKLNAAPAESLAVTYRGNTDEAAWLNRSAAVGRYELKVLSRSGLGRVPVRVRRYDPAGTVEEITLTAEVARRINAVVALRQVRRGEVFSRDNVGVQEVLLTSDHGPTLGSVDVMLGQTAASAIRAGSVINVDHVAPDVLVKRGELVTVDCVSGRLVVSTVGRASEDGVMGDIVAIRNPETRETFYATVSGRRKATITAGVPNSSSLASNGTPQ